MVELYRKLYRELLEASNPTGFQTERAASTRRGLTVNIVLPLNTAGVATSANLVFGKVRGKVESAKCPNSRGG